MAHSRSPHPGRIALLMRGKTLEQFSRASGYTNRYVSAVLRGDERPGQRFILALAEFTETSPQIIFPVDFKPENANGSLQIETPA